MAIFISLICISLLLWLTWRWQRLSFFRKLGIPGPRPNLLFGNMVELYAKGPIQCHTEWIKKYGRTLGYYYGMTPVLLITDPQLIKNIFIKDFPKFINREMFNPLARYSPHDRLTQGVIALPGQAWKDVRSVLTSTFTAAKMKQMAGSMASSIQDMMDLMALGVGKDFDVFDVFQRLTIDVISKTAFGVKTDVFTNPNCTLLNATKVIFCAPYREPTIFIGQCFPALRLLMLKVQLFLQAYRNKFRIPGEMVRNDLKRLLEHRRNNSQAQKPDLLQLMIDSKIFIINNSDNDIAKLEAGNVDAEKKLDAEANSIKEFRTMTDAEIINSSFTVLLAGYETTSTALSYIIYLLAKHPDAQEQLFEEIQQTIQNGEKLEYGTVHKLPFLEKVICETLRLYPPVYLFTNRFALEDMQYDDLFIPKGTLILAPVYPLHHDPEYWTDPERFDPERFSSKPNSDGNITYMAFGAGPRNCLGMRFAQLEIKLSLSHIVHRFRIHLGKKSSKGELFIESRLRTMTPSKGVFIRLEERNSCH